MAGKRPRQESPRRAVETETETSQHLEEQKINVAMKADLLQCYACSGPLTPPLFQCTNGHVSCSECCPDGHLDDGEAEVDCLKCRDPDTTTRCHGVERALAGVDVPCPFRQRGCAEMMPYGSEQDHKASCAHAPRHCPINGCAGYAGKPLREHVRQDHSDLIRSNISLDHLTPLWLGLNEKARVVTLADGGDSEFLIVVGQHMELGRALSVVHLVHESTHEQDFKHRIEVFGKTGVLTLSGAAVHAERLEEPYEADPFLIIPNKTWESRESFRVFIELK